MLSCINLMQSCIQSTQTASVSIPSPVRKPWSPRCGLWSEIDVLVCVHAGPSHLLRWLFPPPHPTPRFFQMERGREPARPPYLCSHCSSLRRPARRRVPTHTGAPVSPTKAGLQARLSFDSFFLLPQSSASPFRRYSVVFSALYLTAGFSRSRVQSVP